MAALARAELRRGWRTLLLVGLLGGLVGAVAVGSLAVARRTTTAYDRLRDATAVDDAHGFVVRHEELVDQIVSLPLVQQSWTGRLGIAQLDGTHAFLGIVAGPDEPSPLIRPIVLEGRMPGGAEPGVVEIALREDFQDEFDVPLGTDVPAMFLDESDYFRFDTGFEGGTPHGPRLRLRVVGTYRMAGGVASLPPGLAGPEALELHADAFFGHGWFARLDGGAGAVDELRAAVEELAAGYVLPPEAAEFTVATVEDTAVADAEVDHTAGLLGRALLALAGSAVVAGGLALAQIASRHHAASAAERQVERALGVTRVQRAAARLAAALPAALVAGGVTALGVALAGRIEPLGGVRRYEPDPGTSVNVALVAAGSAAAVAAALAAVSLSGDLLARRRPGRVLRESSLVERATRLGGSPQLVAGLRFALEPGHGPRAVPVRAATLGALVGIAGVVAGLVYVACLERLVDTPARAGAPYDFYVVDVTEDDLDGVLADERVDDVTMTWSAPVQLGGLHLSGHALEDLRDPLAIHLAEGRLPRTPDEVALGLRAADQLDADVGGTVTVTDRRGEARELAVVGTGVLPAFNGEQHGLTALLTPDGLQRNGLAAAFTGAAVTAAPGADVAALGDALAADFEAEADTAPPEVENLRQLGGLPSAVAATVGAVTLVALVNALVVLVRRRRRDLAMLRAIGFTARQLATSVVVMAVTMTAVGVALGVPLGLAAGATLWRLTAEGAYVVGDASLPWSAIALVAAGALLVGLLASVVPASRARRLPPADLLRAE